MVIKRKSMIDRARDLFLEKTDQTVEGVTRILQAEYPEFSHGECLEAANLVVKVIELLEAKDQL
jgi:hypothetical protein